DHVRHVVYGSAARSAVGPGLGRAALRKGDPRGIDIVDPVAAGICPATDAADGRLLPGSCLGDRRGRLRLDRPIAPVVPAQLPTPAGPQRLPVVVADPPRSAPARLGAPFRLAVPAASHGVVALERSCSGHRPAGDAGGEATAVGDRRRTRRIGRGARTGFAPPAEGREWLVVRGTAALVGAAAGPADHPPEVPASGCERRDHAWRPEAVARGAAGGEAGALAAGQGRARRPPQTPRPRA